MAQVQCKLCGATVEDSDILHRKLDEWVLKLVLKDHPDWVLADGACPQCWEAVEKMKSQADGVNLR